MQPIKVGTTLYKKVYWYEMSDGYSGKARRVKKEGVATLEVTEPGFIATYEEPLSDNPNSDRKARVRAAKVVSIEEIPGSEESWRSLYRVWLGDGEWASINDPYYTYTVGKECRPTSEFNESDYACGSGIHGFLLRESAEKY